MQQVDEILRLKNEIYGINDNLKKVEDFIEGNIIENQELDFKVKLAREEEKIDEELSDLRKTLDEISFENNYYIKRIDGQLANEYISTEDRAFFEEQRELYRKLHTNLEEKFFEAQIMLKKAQNDLYNQEYQEKE